MNNDGWQATRKEARLPLVRIHDLRHTFACLLRAAGDRYAAPFGAPNTVTGGGGPLSFST